MNTISISSELALSEDEVAKITGYSRPSNQLRVLGDLGIPARRRPNNTVLVMRMHCLYPAAALPDAKPKLKSIRK